MLCYAGPQKLTWLANPAQSTVGTMERGRKEKGEIEKKKKKNVQGSKTHKYHEGEAGHDRDVASDLPV